MATDQVGGRGGALIFGLRVAIVDLSGQFNSFSSESEQFGQTIVQYTIFWGNFYATVVKGFFFLIDECSENTLRYAK